AFDKPSQQEDGGHNGDAFSGPERRVEHTFFLQLSPLIGSGMVKIWLGASCFRPDLFVYRKIAVPKEERIK
ncbi:MAG: hypothetical protein VXV97_00805, partial [Pseudomonadota bacterium]|nr:hypothetical protein [Pseudomonadota bacterium]